MFFTNLLPSHLQKPFGLPDPFLSGDCWSSAPHKCVYVSVWVEQVAQVVVEYLENPVGHRYAHGADWGGFIDTYTHKLMWALDLFTRCPHYKLTYRNPVCSDPKATILHEKIEQEWV